MSTGKEMRRNLLAGKYDPQLSALYGGAEAVLARHRQRLCEALTCFEQYYGPGREVHVYSAPGRTELGGNHTDHQGGYGLAAAVDLDMIAVAAQNDEDVIRVKSRGFDKLDVIDLRSSAEESESTHSASLIRGIAEEFCRRGGRAGGFDVYTASDVPRGSGLSSSACFETGIATVINHEFNEGRFSPTEQAIICQVAENKYFGKPSGLLDQLTCGTGGVLFADFADPSCPKTEQLPTQRLLPAGMALCVTDTRGSHSELTGEFAAIRQEMEAVAAAMGKRMLGELPEAEFRAALPRLRESCGDRAVLRAMHYYEENARARAQRDALAQGDFDAFLRLIMENGHSSFMLCQNVICPGETKRQELAVALAVSSTVLRGERAAWRMQGGGFAGTIQAFVPEEKLEEYRRVIEAVFGAGCCYVLHPRAQGGCRLL